MLVIPGVVDSHMHASEWLGGPMSYRMLALAGVTTALEMAGPLESVKRFMRKNGSGISIGCLEQLRPGFNLGTNDPSAEELSRVMRDALRRGAFGVKLLGGHAREDALQPRNPTSTNGNLDGAKASPSGKTDGSSRKPTSPRTTPKNYLLGRWWIMKKPEGPNSMFSIGFKTVSSMEYSGSQ